MLPQSLTELRDEIAAVCTGIASGEIDLLQILQANNSTRSAADSYVYVVKALEVVPGIGKVRARAIMANIGIDERCSIGTLTDQQCAQLQMVLAS